jgi:hypothetical protein
MLVCLFRQLMSAEMVSFVMSGGRGGVGVGGKIVKLCDSVVCTR